MTDKEKKIEEIRRAIALSATYGRYAAVKADHATWMLEEIERLQQERDKAVEGLKYIADLHIRGIHDDVAEPHRQAAKRIMYDLGVSHETT